MQCVIRISLRSFRSRRERKRRRRDGDRRGDTPVRRAEFGDNLPLRSPGIESFRSGGIGWRLLVYVLLGDLVDLSRSPGGKSRCRRSAPWSRLEGEEGTEGNSCERRGERARTCVSTSGEYKLRVRKEGFGDCDIDLCFFFPPRDALGMRIGGWKLFGRCFFFCKPISSSAFQVRSGDTAQESGNMPSTVTSPSPPPLLYCPISTGSIALRKPPG